jgi:hypothetical protein
MTSMQDVTWSDLLQQPRDTVAKLEQGGERALRVHRRDGEDLVLTTAARATQDHEMVGIAVRLLVAIMNDPATRSRHLIDLLPKVFPWVRFLPDDDAIRFVQELVDVMSASEELETPAPVLQVVTEWRHTAEVHADPELAAALRRGTTDDLGPVPAPAT